MLPYLQSWCSCVHPVTGSLPSGPCGRCCGCDSTPLLTGSARTSSWPPARSDDRASPGSLQPDRERHAMRHIWGINRQDLTSVAVLLLCFSVTCWFPAGVFRLSLRVCVYDEWLTVRNVLFQHVRRRKDERQDFPSSIFFFLHPHQTTHLRPFTPFF